MVKSHLELIFFRKMEHIIDDGVECVFLIELNHFSSNLQVQLIGV